MIISEASGDDKAVSAERTLTPLEASGDVRVLHDAMKTFLCVCSGTCIYLVEVDASVPKCDLCGSDENVLVDHYEDHIKRRLNICMKCHANLHVAIYFHAYDSLWSEGYGDPLKREYYKELHRVLVNKGLIRCDECKPSFLSLLEKYFDEELKKLRRQR